MKTLINYSNKILVLFATCIIFLFAGTNAFSQGQSSGTFVTGYSLSNANSGWIELSGAVTPFKTTLANTTTAFANVTYAFFLPTGKSYTFNGTTYVGTGGGTTGCVYAVNTNGWMTLNNSGVINSTTTLAATTTTPLTSTTILPASNGTVGSTINSSFSLGNGVVFSAFGRALVANAAGTNLANGSELYVASDADGVIYVEYRNMKNSGAVSRHDFEIIVLPDNYLGNGLKAQVQYRYGIHTNATATTCQVGIRGWNGANDCQLLQASAAVGSWIVPVLGVASGTNPAPALTTMVVGITAPVLPDNGRTYQYSACIVTPSYATVPFFEGFESSWGSSGCRTGITNDRPTTNWSGGPLIGNASMRRNTEEASGYWSSIASGLTAPLTGTGCSRFHIFSASTGHLGVQDLFIDLSGGLKALEFDDVNTTTSATATDSIIVLLSNDGGLTFPTRLGAFGNHFGSSTWIHRTLQIFGGTATSVIRFLGRSGFGSVDPEIDNVSVTIPVCSGTPTAGAITVPASVCSGASFNMTLAGSSTGAAITYQWQRDNGSGFVNFGSGGTSQSDVITGATTYRVIVTCFSTGQSATTTPVAVTLTSPPTLPYFQGFNSTSIPTDCWSQQLVVGASNIQYVASSGNPATLPQQGTNYVFWNAFSITNNNETRLVSPQFNAASISTLNVDFFWDNDNNASYNAGQYLLEGVTVQYSTNGTTWTNAQFIPRHDPTLAVGTSAWKLKSVTLPPAAGNQPVLFVGFLFHSGFGDNCSMDAVNIYANLNCAGTPNAGVISAPVNACSGSSFIVTSSGLSAGLGISYQWQKASSCSGPWTNIIDGGGTSGATTATLTTTQTLATSYQLVTTCAFGGSNQSNCASVGLMDCINMTNGTFATCNGKFYDSGGPSGTYQNFENYILTITPTAGTNLTRLIFNSFAVEACCDRITIYNGIGTGGSILYGPAGGTLSIGTITATLSGNPTGSLTIQYTSDLSIVGAGWDADISCVNYAIPPNCPTVFSPSGAATVSPSTLLTWNSPPTGGSPTGYNIYWGTASNPPLFASNVGTLSLNVPNDINTTYFWRVEPTNSYGTATTCAVNTYSTNDVFNMTNGTFTTCSGHFYDSGGPAGTYLVSENYTITFTPSTPGASVNLAFASFNTETGYDRMSFYNGTSTAAPLLLGDGTFYPPYCATCQVAGNSGTSLPAFNVTSNLGGNPTGSITVKFVSDPSVQYAGWDAVISCFVCTTTSAPATISGPSCAVTGQTLLYTSSGGSGAREWEISTVSAAGPYTATGVTSANVNITFNAAGIFYGRVRTGDPGCIPSYSNVLTLEARSAYDDVCGLNGFCGGSGAEVPLVFGTNGPFNNAGASVQAGEPAPPATGCGTQTGWCNSTLANTMWFQFTAPASGRIRISANGFDTQLALWDAADCNAILSGGATLIAANDDDPDYTLHGGNLFSSWIQPINCLVPGKTYFVQFDGYSTTGIYTIGLQDLGDDGLAPTFTLCPSNVAVAANSNCEASVSWTAPTASDNCAVTSLTLTSEFNSIVTSLAPGTTSAMFPKGVTTLTYTASDAQGHTAVCSFTVTVIDLTPPFINTIPDLLGQLTDPGQCSKIINNPAIDAVFSDNCGVVKLTWSKVGATTASSPATGINKLTESASGQLFNRDGNTNTTVVTYTATDAAGLTFSRTFLVEVLDQENPVIDLSAFQVTSVPVNAAGCHRTVTITKADACNGGVTDNCLTIFGTGPCVANTNVGFFSRSDGQPLAAPYTNGITTVTWKATDASGNTSYASQTVEITTTTPHVTSLTTPNNIITQNTSAVFTGTWTSDPNQQNLVTMDWDDGTSPYVTTVPSDPSGTTSLVLPAHTFALSEIAEPKLKIKELCGNKESPFEGGTSSYQFLVVTTTSNNHAHAGGWYYAPSNAYPTGYQNDRFNVGTHVGATGNGNNVKGTFQSVRHTAQDFKIHTNQSANYTQITVEYYVLQGCSLAVYRMPCRINGNLGYHLTVWMTDRDRVPAVGNRIRVRVMQDSPSTLIYDTQPFVLDNVLPSTQLSQGTVKITPANNSGCTARELADAGVSEMLLQNIPNPFSNTTQISFMIPEGGYTTLKVYNYLGEEVRSLYAGNTEAGETTTVTFDGSGLNSGVYFYTLTGTGVTETRKMVIQK